MSRKSGLSNKAACGFVNGGVCPWIIEYIFFSINSAHLRTPLPPPTSHACHLANGVVGPGAGVAVQGTLGVGNFSRPPQRQDLTPGTDGQGTHLRDRYPGAVLEPIPTVLMP